MKRAWTDVSRFGEDGLHFRVSALPPMHCGIDGCCEGLDPSALRFTPNHAGFTGPHGIDGGKRRYVVGDATLAVSLMVGTGEMCPSVTWCPDYGPEGRDFSVHKVPVEGVDPDDVTACTDLPGGRCVVGGSALYADERYAKLRVGVAHDKALVPDEVVLRWLEREFREEKAR